MGRRNRCDLILLWSIGLLVLIGCDRPAPVAPSGPTRFEGVRLVVGVAGEAALGTSVAAQRGEWVAQTGSELVIREEPIDPGAVPEDVDIIVFAGDRLGDLVDAGALMVLPEPSVGPTAGAAPAPPSGPESSAAADRPAAPADLFRFGEVAPVFRDTVGRYGTRRFGLPIGGSALVVAFQRRAFDSPVLVEAARAAGLALEPPRTWEEFDALARFFQGKDLDGDGTPDFGVALGWGPDAEGVGDSTFLARSAAAALHPDQFAFLLDSETTEPRVASPPFREALAALVDLRAAGPPGEPLTIEGARAAFRSGRVALLIDRAEAAGRWGSGQFAIGVAPLPGSNRVYDPARGQWEATRGIGRPSYLPSGGGWLVGVAAKTRQKAAAEAFGRYLAGPETTERLRAERDFPMLAVRTPQLAQGLLNPRSALGVEARSWTDAVGRTLQADKAVPGLRIPGAAAYLADLTTARVAALAGQPVERALADLAAVWSKETADRNLARQTWHHRQSLNGPSTAPEPPPR